MHAIADIDDAGDDLARHAEAEVVFVARLHHTHEFPRAVLDLERDALYSDRTLGLGGGRGIGVASREQDQRGQSQERWCVRARGRHGATPSSARR
jgi:hypothetical protein